MTVSGAGRNRAATRLPAAAAAGPAGGSGQNCCRIATGAAGGWRDGEMPTTSMLEGNRY